MFKKQLLLLLFTSVAYPSEKPTIMEVLDSKIEAAQTNQTGSRTLSALHLLFTRPLAVFTDLCALSALHRFYTKPLTVFRHMTTEHIYITNLTDIRNRLNTENTCDVEALIKCYNECMEHKKVADADNARADREQDRDPLKSAYFHGISNGFEAVDNTIFSIVLDNTN